MGTVSGGGEDSGTRDDRRKGARSGDTTPPPQGGDDFPRDAAPASKEIDAGAVTRLLERVHEGDAGSVHELLQCVYAQLRAIAARRMAGERHGHTLQPTALVHEAYARLFDGATPEFTDSEHFFVVASRVMQRILIDHARRRLVGGAPKRGSGSGGGSGASNTTGSDGVAGATGASVSARSSSPANGPGPANVPGSAHASSHVHSAGSIDPAADEQPPRAPARRAGPRNPVPLPDNVLSLARRDDPAEILAVSEAVERFQGVDPRASQVVRLRFFGGLSIKETALALGWSVRTVEREWEYARGWLADRLRSTGLGPPASSTEDAP